MRILTGGVWRDGFLDYHRYLTYRVAVRRCVPALRVDDLFFVRRRSLRMLINYCAEIGPAEVAKKIRSRSAERARNEKFVLVGQGIVVEAPAAVDRLHVGTPVTFVAPCHPACAERIVLPAALRARANRSVRQRRRDPRLRPALRASRRQPRRARRLVTDERPGPCPPPRGRRGLSRITHPGPSSLEPGRVPAGRHAGGRIRRAGASRDRSLCSPLRLRQLRQDDHRRLPPARHSLDERP